MTDLNTPTPLFCGKKFLANYSPLSTKLRLNFSSSRAIYNINMSKKVVVTLELHDNKDKQKAMKAVSSLPGLESLAVNMKEKKLTVIGDVDPVQVVAKLRKSWHAEIVTVGPGKEPEKKQLDDKDSGKKEDEKKKEMEKMAQLWKQYNNNYTHPYYTIYYSAEENPNSCVIC